MYIARTSEFINEDIARNWSSWNYGQEGFEGTRTELDEKISSLEEDETMWFSGFEMTAKELRNSTIRELYENYWVLVDQEFKDGIAGVELEADTLEEAIKKMKNSWVGGQGVKFDTKDAKLVYSEDNYHIFEI
ncbi:MAG: hypothetical protein H0X41_07940 [Chitinophagaceae bacterium]|nr:hypothetical protein [Chitinophagaceae bacterium]